MSTEAPTTTPPVAPKDDAKAAAATDGTAAPRPFKSAALYVGDLHPEVTEATLFEIFNAVAPVASVRVCRHAVTRRSLGYAYVNFHSTDAADKVLESMNYTIIKGRMCRLMWSQRDPTLRKSGSGNVFIKNLHEDIDSKDLADTFSIFGAIISCKVVVDYQTGKSRGYGFVHFETKEAADEAIAKVNGNMISEKQVFVGHFQRPDERSATKLWTNLYVKNLPVEWDDAKLKEFFESCGAVASALVMVDDAGVSKGFGFVDYEEHESAVKCVDTLHKTEVEGTILSAHKAKAAKAAKAAASADGAAAAAEPTKVAAAKAAEPTKSEPAERTTIEFAEDGTPIEKVVTRPVPEGMCRLFIVRFQKKRERAGLLRDDRRKGKLERTKKFLGKNLYVRNLDDSVTDEILRSEFAQYGEISSARVMKERDTERPRGFGFVCFENREDASQALQVLNGHMLYGKPLYVALWQPRDDRRNFLQRQHISRRQQQQFMGPRGMGMAGQMPMGPMGMLGGPGGQRGGPQGGPQQMGPGMFMQGPGPARGYGMPMNYPPQGMYQQQGPGGEQRRGGRGGRGGPQGPPQQMQGGMQYAQGPPPQQQQYMRGGPGGMPPASAAAAAAAAGVSMQAPMMQQMMQPPQQPMGRLTAQDLASATPEGAKNMIGEKLYPQVHMRNQELAGKITGMLLDGMETSELLHLLESQDALDNKIEEAISVLEASATGN